MKARRKDSNSLSIGTFSQGLHQVPVFHKGHCHDSTTDHGCQRQEPRKDGDENKLQPPAMTPQYNSLVSPYTSPVFYPRLLSKESKYSKFWHSVVEITIPIPTQNEAETAFLRPLRKSSGSVEESGTQML